MENIIVAYINPFIIRQHIFVLNDKADVIKEVVVDFDSAPNKIIELVKANNVKTIHLKGNMTFTQKIKERISINKNFSAGNDIKIIIE